MAVQPGVWGIDLGQCALKAIRVESIDGQVTATAFDYVEHPKILSQPDADPDQLTREAMEKFLSRNNLRGDIVAISIPGQSGLARFVKLPPVEEKKIGDIVKFEAKQQIPFNLEEVVWDYQKLSSGVVTDGFAMETEIGLFAIKRDTVNRYLQHFKDVNVEVHIVQMAPLALCNFVSYDLLNQTGDAVTEAVEPGAKKRCVVALDIGADNTNLVITDGNRIIWQRPIPLGGNHFTRALTKDMKLTFAKAEHLKRNATKSPELKQILSSLKPVLNDFVGEVQRSLGYFTNTHRDAAIQYMMGLGSAFRLPGLQKFLSEKLQIDVRKLQKLERLAGDEVVTAPVYTDNVLSFAVAYGLALQGLNAARLHTNLLPQEIRVERMIRAKKPWAVTAAASILVGTAILAIGYNRQFTAVASPIVKDQINQVDAVKTKADGFEKAVGDVQRQIDEHKKGVKSIILGQDERLNWIQFNQFVNRAVPKPDGSNLNEVPTGTEDKVPAKKRYWDWLGQLAYQKYSAQQLGTAKASEKIDEEQWRDDLVQANVESIYCVFCPKLGDFYNRLKSEGRDVQWASDKDRNTPPKDDEKGWVVEIRGYTYHKDNVRFVTKTLLDNLARMPIVIRAGQGQQPAKPAEGGAQPSAEAPKPAPSTPPPAAAGGQTSGTGATAVTPGVAEADKSKDNNQVSLVVLYRYTWDPNFEPTNFNLINSRVVDSLIGGGAGGGGALPGGMAGMEPGAGRAAQAGAAGLGGGGNTSINWTPLGTDGVGGGGAGGGLGGGVGAGGGLGGGARGGAAGNKPMMGMGMGMERMMGKGSGFGMGLRPPDGLGGLGAPGAGDGSEEVKKRKLARMRTEFIILFAWNEPTPSVEYMAPPPEEPAAATGGGMNMGMGGGGAAPIK